MKSRSLAVGLEYPSSCRSETKTMQRWLKEPAPPSAEEVPRTFQSLHFNPKEQSELFFSSKHTTRPRGQQRHRHTTQTASVNSLVLTYRDKSNHYLFRFSCNEIPNSLTEETGKQRVQRRLVIQEVIEDVQQSFIPSQLVVDLRHVRGQQFTGCVWISGRTDPEQLKVK